MGPLGWEETVVIFLLALLLFGPKKLPELGRTIGKAITEFRRASNELKSTFDREMKSLELETESMKQIASEYQYDTYNYDYSSYETNSEAYESETIDSTATSPSNLSASATQGAESPTVVSPEGAIARGTEAVHSNVAAGHHAAEPDAGDTGHHSTTEHNA